MARARTTEPKEEETPPLSPSIAEHLVGHAAQEKQLLAQVLSGKLPHALLFTGPKGVGKATLAWRLARFLAVPRETKADSLFGADLPPETLYVSAQHAIFRRMAAGAHPDFLLLEADDIKVEHARSVAAFLSLTPAESNWRVVIIDSADAMNRNAANALLKTLEEPPARAVILLISHNPGVLLPTIRSRCRMVRVPPLKSTEFARVMGMIAPELSPEEAQTWSLLSAGSPGVAVGLIEARVDMLYKELIECVTAPDTVKHHAFADRFARKEATGQWQAFSRMFLWLLARITAQGGGPEVFAGEHAALAKLRESKPLKTWLELWERAGVLLADTEHLHLDKKQAVLTLLKATKE